MVEGNSLLSNTEKLKFISTDFPYARSCVMLSKTTFYCSFLNFGVEKKDGMSWKEIMFSLRTLVWIIIEIYTRLGVDECVFWNISNREIKRRIIETDSIKPQKEIANKKLFNISK